MRTSSASRALDAENQRQILTAFRAKRATSVGSARPLLELGLNDSKALKRLVATLVLRRAGPDRYFLDEDVLASQRNLSGRGFLPVAVVLVVIAVAAALYAFAR